VNFSFFSVGCITVTYTFKLDANFLTMDYGCVLSYDDYTEL